MTYRVRIGGSPENSGEMYDDLDDAIETAIAMAREMAGGGEVGYYDLTDRGGSRGVCPEGDDGGYWPIIETIED